MRRLLGGATLAALAACGGGDEAAEVPAGTTLANGAVCTSAAAEAGAAQTIEGFLDGLPYGTPTGEAKREVVEAILRTCRVFSPTALAQRDCWALLASAILKESSYDAEATVTDAYAKRTVEGRTAEDPTVGLLQIRFSATVHDVARFAPPDALACVGCALPEEIRNHVEEPGDSTFWAVTGPTAHRGVMTSRACNVAMGAWYYFTNATGNGDPAKPAYAEQVCGGEATGANLVTGLRSHLRGPDGANGVVADEAALDALRTTDPDSFEYVGEIRTRFDAMVGARAGAHPFFTALAPERARYCR